MTGSFNAKQNNEPEQHRPSENIALSFQQEQNARN
jgi:hypothetical protein